MPNPHLSNSKKIKNDEFYTYFEDIIKELNHYQQEIKNKIIYCNCDSDKSSFVHYFKILEEQGYIKELIYSSNDFSAPENIEKLKRADIVITNPPFSIFKKYFMLLKKYNKKFLILGSNNACAYSYIFKEIKNKKLWLGYNCVNVFRNEKNDTKSVMAYWYTNLKEIKPAERKQLKLIKKFHPDKYPKYANYEAIEVGYIKDIPEDYYGLIGVPQSILRYNYENYFELITVDALAEKKPLNVIEKKNNKKRNLGKVAEGFCIKIGADKAKYFDNENQGYKAIYARIIIKRKERFYVNLKGGT